MRRIQIAAAAAALFAAAAGVQSTAASAETVYSAAVNLQETIGGGQTVSPTGATGYPRLSVGYGFQIPSLTGGQTANVTVSSPAIAFAWKCVALATTGLWHVNMASSTHTVTTQAWWPSPDPKAASTLTNTVAVPNSCRGGNITIKSFTFINAFSSTASNPVNFRWHFVYCTSASSCTSGAWTTTFAVTPVAGGVYPPPAVAGLHLVKPVVKPKPSPIPFTGAEIGGMIAGAVILLAGGSLLLLAARRRRREQAASR